jgi:hypothetical protein
MRSQRFHGRYEETGRECEAEGCDEPGEFRAPGSRSAGFDGPGDWRWYCLEHVREFNSTYDWFEGMSADEILAAQSPIAGWRTETRAFRADAGVDGMPRWADFHDPLDAIASRFGLTMIGGGVVCLIHALFPALFERTGSTAIKRLYSEMVARQPGTPPPAYEDPQWRPEYEI